MKPSDRLRAEARIDAVHRGATLTEREARIAAALLDEAEEKLGWIVDGSDAQPEADGFRLALPYTIEAARVLRAKLRGE